MGEWKGSGKYRDELLSWVRGCLVGELKGN